MRLAVIPARGGSKRIPRKNIKLFAGRPIIAWSIDAARDSGCFDRIIVSTDDAEIAEVARAAGAEVPFMRPMALADDHTGTIDVMRHAIEHESHRHPTLEFACCIYATAPMLVPVDLRAALETLMAGDADFAVSVTKYPFPIQRAVRVDSRRRLSMFDPDQFATRSQDLEEAYHDAAQFYWGRSAAWLSATTLFGSATAAVVIPRHRAQDIDTPEDWLRAEAMFRALQASP